MGGILVGGFIMGLIGLSKWADNASDKSDKAAGVLMMVVGFGFFLLLAAHYT